MMASNAIILAILIPLVAAILLLFFWYLPRVQRWIGVAGHAALLLFASILLYSVKDGSILTMQAGQWAAPYGITFVVDALSALMILLTAIVGLAVGLYSAISIESRRTSFGFFPLIQFLIMGLTGSFIAGDIFNLYVWFEVIIIASFALITLGGEKAQLAGAMKYVTLNLIASVFFLTAIAILYGILGSLNLADLAEKVLESQQRGLINTIAVLFLVAFGIKSALFPLYFWLPDSYHTPPAAVSAIFGGLLTKVGVYAFIRVFSLLFMGDPFIGELLGILAVVTMIIGAMGALNANNIRLIFSYLIISHIGFMLGGLGMFSQIALAGAVFYMAHDIIAKTNLFLISGLIHNMKGSYQIKKLGGLFNDYPFLSLVLALAMFSVVGIPPLSGFWPKVLLLKGAVEGQHYAILVGVLVASFLTLWAMVRIWAEAFWKPQKALDKAINKFKQRSFNRRGLMLTSIVGLAMVSLYFGLGWTYMVNLCSVIADQLVDTQPYIEAVLKTSGP
jgi:multicomponent Na+:H+ antiporter subunit D